MRNGDDDEVEPEQQGRLGDVGDGGGSELLGEVGIPAWRLSRRAAAETSARARARVRTWNKARSKRRNRAASAPLWSAICGSVACGRPAAWWRTPPGMRRWSEWSLTRRKRSTQEEAPTVEMLMRHWMLPYHAWAHATYPVHLRNKISKTIQRGRLKPTMSKPHLAGVSRGTAEGGSGDAVSLEHRGVFAPTRPQMGWAGSRRWPGWRGRDRLRRSN